MIEDDGLPLDDVGAWAKEKHERLRKYVGITRAVRAKFIKESSAHPRPGGATYIDLYCGAGRAIVRETGERIHGSPLLAFKTAQAVGAPFSEIHVADMSEEKCRAVEERIAREGGTARIEVGPADETVRRIVGRLDPEGLHFAFLDPYNLEALPFSVFEALSNLRRIDMLIHVSAQDLQRNLGNYIAGGDARLDRFAPGWRLAVDLNQSQQRIRASILSHWAEQIGRLGLPPAAHAELVTGSKNQRLYWLMFASKHDFAKELWNKIRTVSGQGQLL